MSGYAWVWVLVYAAEVPMVVWFYWRRGYFHQMLDDWRRGSELRDERNRLREKKF